MTFHSKHRSRALAERKRRSLERKHGVPFLISERRTARGKYSKRGHYFTFKAKKQGRRNYLVSLTFTRGKDRKQLHVEAIMKGKSLEQIVEQIENNNVEDENFEFVQWWHGKKPPSRTSRNASELENFLYIAVDHQIRKVRRKAKNRRDRTPR